jgi:hypothetical protein
LEKCGGLDSFCLELWLEWEICELSNDCREFRDFLRQSDAWVSAPNLTVLILAVCRYVNACGYCMGR